MQLTLPALSVNEGAARAIVSAFCAQLNPTIEEIADIKCAVSEAVTNCIVHGYKTISVRCCGAENDITIKIISTIISNKISIFGNFEFFFFLIGILFFFLFPVVIKWYQNW